MSRTIKQLSRREIHTIATEYANTPCYKSCSYFCENFGISESTFYNVLYSSVYKGIVDTATCERIEKKSKSNSDSAAGVKAAIRSIRKYNKLLILRESYLPTKKEQKKTAELFAAENLSLKQFARKYYFSEDLLGRILESSITNNIISDSVLEVLEQNAIQRNGKRAELYFSKLKETRSNK